MSNSIFISYNSDSFREKEIAHLLYKEGWQNGYNVYLPDESAPRIPISPRTKAYISQSDWFIIFSTESLTQAVLDEINYAERVKKINPEKIIVIFSKSKGINTNFNNKIKPFFINQFDSNDIQQNILQILNTISINEQKSQERTTLGWVLGLGLAALLWGALTDAKRGK